MSDIGQPHNLRPPDSLRSAVSRFLSLVLLAGYELQRTHLAWLIIAAMGIAFGLATFAAGLAVTESVEHRIVFYAAISRLLGAFILSLLVVTNVVRDSDDQVLALMLSRPVSRSLWLLAKATTYVLVAMLGAAILALPLAFIGCSPTATLIWALSFACELAIVTVAALVAASSLAHVPLAFGAVTGFYLLSRATQGLVLLSRDSIIDLSTATNQWAALGVSALAHVLPDFAEFTRSGWLIDALPTAVETASILIQTAIYVPLLLIVGMIDFQRRNY